MNMVCQLERGTTMNARTKIRLNSIPALRLLVCSERCLCPTWSLCAIHFKRISVAVFEQNGEKVCAPSRK